ncbi:glycoside hydrolase family 3 protein [Candidatus Woesearchaeota archaeon]|jgi:beta-N-acetylhexosaminidase|nr:glycoside hydrolase family 3 protein [Candidatus Woesearchaeota archaeon]MBT4110329.1 glycoside hydrolase family 3 protein [Candidatus Woesearchaeota archaeon]MBT4336147.1 glycoside hydrolase family 3 protein [Candidatus Woesearchaeota archaeon]MBT4468874.1 glycoside hydrolase family 3 protein [Candidatus Woesearchaeota archaeon]MBT6744807.1 glycoside hydrolase family 3 protein [Candidatus Woesearchaeota archaeon]
MAKKKQKKSRWSLQQKVFLVLIIIVLTLGSLNVAKAKGWLIPEQPEIIIVDNTILLDSLTLEQKIGQMVIVHGGLWNLKPWQDMQLGGIHHFAMQTPELFQDITAKFQEDMQIPFFVTADLEGCWSPFSNFKQFVPVNEINTTGEAFEKGSIEGKYLKELGFNFNFAPVVDLDDQIWNCRAFLGNETQITQLAEAYAIGLQNEGIIATAKHYPGNTLVANDPHKGLVIAEISSEDQYPYNYFSEKGNIQAVMVTHIIAFGEVDSKGVPSVVSEEAVGQLKDEYSGLIVTDDTMMLGLRNFFPSTEDMYVAVFKAGNDLIINFDEDPNEIKHMIEVVQGAVLAGEIPQEQIDDSVKRILEAKGFIVG